MFFLHVLAVCPWCISIMHVNASFPCSFPCCMSMPHVYAACSCCMSMLYVHASMSMLPMLDVRSAYRKEE
jgi:hypothetical protein